MNYSGSSYISSDRQKKDTMAIDVFENAGKGINAVWDNRSVLLKLALIPVLIKIGCHVLIYITQFQDELLWQGIIRIPDFVTEGWLLCILIYLLSADGNDAPDSAKNAFKSIKTNTKAIQAGVIAYVLIQLLVIGYNALLFENFGEYMRAGHENEIEEDAQVGPAQIALMLFAFLVVIAFFKYLWLYIPIARGWGLSGTLRMLGGNGLSLRFLFLWALCIVPVTVIFIGVVGLILENSGGDLSSAPKGVSFVVLIFQSLYETITALILTSAFFFAFQSLDMKARGIN